MYKFSSQAAQQTWDALVSDEDHWFEASLAFGSQTASTGVKFDDGLISVETQYAEFSTDSPTVGGCVAAELTASLLKPSFDIPRMARVRLYVRATNGTTDSAWVPQGVFLIDTRQTTHNSDGRDILTIHAYDYMLKAEAPYPSTSGTWPKTDTAVVSQIASTLGVSVDARTNSAMDKNYPIYAPAGYSMREVLGNIGAMYAGNWVMTIEGKLLLVTLKSFPDETSLLIDNLGNVIMFGEDAISLVSTI